MTAIDVGVSVRDDDEHLRTARKVGYDMSQQVHARRVGPVRIVEHEQQGVFRGGRAEDVDDRVEQEKALVLDVGHLRRRQARHPHCELGHDPGELAASSRDVLAQHRLVGFGNHGTERFDPRRECAGHVFVAPTEHHERAVAVRRAREFGREPSLADTGFTAQQRDRRSLDLRLLPDVGQTRAFGVATRERQLVFGRA